MKRAALARMEAAARTESDFMTIVAQWDKLDENRERKERYHEMGRDEQTLELGHSDGLIFPVPIIHPAWRETIKGDFLAMIFDNAEEMWQIIEDQDIAVLVNNLTDRQKEILFLSAIRRCSPQQIACYKDKTDRAVRKLLTAAITSIRNNLTPLILEQITSGFPGTTLAKRRFIELYR